jgi:hypothetical protein
MTSQGKAVWDINENPKNPSQKINAKQYLNSDQEPAEMRSSTESVELERKTPIIKDAHLRKEIFRRIAHKLRLGAKNATI